MLSFIVLTFPSLGIRLNIDPSYSRALHSPKTINGGKISCFIPCMNRREAILSCRRAKDTIYYSISGLLVG